MGCHTQIQKVYKSLFIIFWIEPDNAKMTEEVPFTRGTESCDGSRASRRIHT